MKLFRCWLFILLAGSLWPQVSVNSQTTGRAPGPALATRDAYVFSYFKRNGEDGLHLAYSEDGLVWHELNGGKSLLKPFVGRSKLMRDPQIIAGADGLFHMVWTT